MHMNCDDANGGILNYKNTQFGIMDVCLWWLLC